VTPKAEVKLLPAPDPTNVPAELPELFWKAPLPRTVFADPPLS